MPGRTLLVSIAAAATLCAAPASGLAQQKVGGLSDESPPSQPESETTTEPKSETSDKKPEDKQPEEKAPEGETTETKQPAEKVDPRILEIELMDGSVVIGKLSIDSIDVVTEFGKLNVPIVRVREFRPGLESHSNLFDRVSRLIEQLGGDDYKQREEAHKMLVKMGPQIRGELERYRKDKNAERARRVKAILATLQEAAETESEFGREPEQWKRGDTIETTRFTVVGNIHPDVFTVLSPYGTLTIRLADIKSARRKATMQREEIRKTLDVEGTYLAQQKYKSSGIRVQKGDRISVRASGQIQRSSSSSYVSGPGGSSRFGSFSQNPPILGGTLVARIGHSGKVLKVGSGETFVAGRSGVLRFAIGMRPDYVGRYQFRGKYDLKIYVKPGDQ